MPIPTIDQFKALVRKSGAVAPENLERALTAFAPAADEKDPTRALVRFLIARKLLTPWQSEQLLRGKSQLCLGPYRLLGRLGAGGMSTVFAAEHTVMRRQVAIKVLPKDHTSRPQALDRFLREAQVISSCNHPNVVQAYDVDHVQGIFFIVLERVEGRDLEKMVLVDGPLSADRTADFIRQAAEGLAHVHAQGVVHRDVKPSNFLLDLTGVVKLLDLGVALLTMDDGHSQTTKQTTLGTTEYMAPEQAMDSHAVDARADLYSLGCTMYFLLTGGPPFPARTMAEALLKHLKHEAKPIAVCREDMGLPEVPDDLIAVCEKLMAKKPQDRYQTADDLAADLTSWQARRSMSISETWTNESQSETPTQAWSPAPSSKSDALPERAWENDETTETKALASVETEVNHVPPVIRYGDAETVSAGSTLQHDEEMSLAREARSSSPRAPVEAPPAELEPEPEATTLEVAAASWVDKPSRSAQPALGAAEEGAKSPATLAALPRSKPAPWIYAAAGAAVLLIAVVGLWASGMFSAGDVEPERPSKGRRKAATDDAAAAPRWTTVGRLTAVPGTKQNFHAIPGRIGRALLADGKTALVYESQPGLEPTELTLECWVRLQETPEPGQRPWLVAKNDSERSAGHYSLVLEGDRIAALVNPTGEGEPIRLVGDTPIAPGTWRCAALVDDGREFALFLDGKNVAQAPAPAKRQSGTGPFAIAVRPDRGTPPSQGVHIDEVRLFYRALVESELKLRAERPDWAANQTRSIGVAASWTFDPLRLENPSFEADNRGWNVHSGARIDKDRSKAHEGEKFVRLPDGRNGAECNIYGLTPGATYTFVGWARSGTAADHVMLGVKDYGGRELKVPISSTTWTAAAIPFTVRNDGTARIFAWKSEGGHTLFDDVTVFVGVPDPLPIAPGTKVAFGPAVDAIALSSMPGLDPLLQVDPARLALREKCGQGGAPESMARDGYSVQRLSGGEFGGWPSEAPRQHCWTDGQALFFTVSTPKDATGVLRLLVCDGDKKGRRQRINVDGHDAGEVYDFAEVKQLLVAVDQEMTADGKIEIACFATGNGEAVVSDVEFYGVP